MPARAAVFSQATPLMGPRGELCGVLALSDSGELWRGTLDQIDGRWSWERIPGPEAESRVRRREPLELLTRMEEELRAAAREGNDAEVRRIQQALTTYSGTAY